MRRDQDGLHYVSVNFNIKNDYIVKLTIHSKIESVP